tara:strand:- start:232 stop:642 length:411 start_codon:yes stop_codon:yes gene_type:complete
MSISIRWSDDYQGKWKDRCYLAIPMADINSADAPTDSNTKAQIKTWMDAYGYEYASGDTKAELLAIVGTANALIKQAIQTDKASLRKNVAGDEALLKFSCDNDADNDPAVFSTYAKKSHPQIMEILDTDAWTSETE